MGAHDRVSLFGDFGRWRVNLEKTRFVGRGTRRPLCTAVDVIFRNAVTQIAFLAAARVNIILLCSLAAAVARTMGGVCLTRSTEYNM